MNVLETPPRRITALLQKGKIPVCVVGMGHVGLPLALLLANQGVKVVGCDNNEAFLQQLRAGRSPIVEHSKNLFASSRVLPSTCPNCGVRILKVGRETFCPSCMREVKLSSGSVMLTTRLHKVGVRSEASHEMENLLAAALRSGNLELTRDTSEGVSRSGIIVITVGTPIDANRQPDPGAIVSASKDIGRGLKEGDVVIVRSTVSPGTTERLVGEILTKESGLEPGKGFGLAHVPETTIEGLALFELKTLPKMIGGVDKRSAAAAAALFSVFKTPVHFFDGPRITETAKLFLNIYRDVNIALANEFALACEAVGVDVMKVIEATHVDPKTTVLTPGPGVGGYCLPKDAFYLTQPAALRGFVPNVITAARGVNDGMPSHVRQLVLDALKEAHVDAPGARVTVLGLAFKGNTADTRESPSLSVIEKLREDGAEITVHDPLVKVDDKRSAVLKARRGKSLRDSVRGADAVVVLTDHLEYRSLTGAGLKRIEPGLRVIVDARHILDPNEARAAGLVYRGVGHGRID